MSIFGHRESDSIALPAASAEGIERREEARRKSKDRRFTFKADFALLNFFLALIAIAGLVVEFTVYQAQLSYYAARVNKLEQKVVNLSHARIVQPEYSVPSGSKTLKEASNDSRLERRIQSLEAALTNRPNASTFNPSGLKEVAESVVKLNVQFVDTKTTYGSAGYLGNGYFITVKHGVVSLDPQHPSQAKQIKVRLENERELDAEIVDLGSANSEVDPGDWAIIRVVGEVNIPILHVNKNPTFEFGTRFARIGNDYNKGSIPDVGLVGPHLSDGLVTAITGAYPGVSGGAVVDENFQLIGIPIGRMQGDYRYSYILPLRSEMFRKVPHLHS